MANCIFHVLKPSSAFNLLCRINKMTGNSLFVQTNRYLYAPTALGIDNFKQYQEKVRNQMSGISDKFRSTIKEYLNDEKKGMIFTEDLKNMIHIADNEEDLTLVVEMMKKYSKQNNSLRFGNFIFGPVVMRLFYVHNKPDLALECFKLPELSSFFDQHISFQILMDLLYENQRYDEMLKVTELISEKQLLGVKYPKNVLVLTFAACYKLNTPESLDYALQLWEESIKRGGFTLRRAITFCAALALNQNRPEVALEILGTSQNQNYTTVRNLKIDALSRLGRLEDIMPILKSVVNQDVPAIERLAGAPIHTFNRDIINKIKKIILEFNNTELIAEFNRLEEIFEREGHLSDISLDAQLCSEIQAKAINRKNTNFNNNYNQFNSQRNSRNVGYNNSRPRFSNLG